MTLESEFERRPVGPESPLIHSYLEGVGDDVIWYGIRMRGKFLYFLDKLVSYLSAFPLFLELGMMGRLTPLRPEEASLGG